MLKVKKCRHHLLYADFYVPLQHENVKRIQKIAVNN